MLVPRPTGSHVAGAAPKRRAPDALSLNLRAGISPQQRQLDLQEIQSWFQRGAVQGGLWLPEWAYLKQESAGTAVTAAGQVVGTWRDAAWGGQLGPELVTNGDFSNGLTGWDTVNTDANNTVTAVSGGCQVVTNGAASDSVGPTQSFSTITGALYEVNYEIISSTSGGVGAWVGTTKGASNITSFTVTSIGKKKLYFIASGAITWVAFVRYSAATVLIDNASVRQVFGNNGFQTTTANKLLTAITPQTQLPWLNSDADDKLPVVFPSALGSACTIARATPTGVEFSESQTINATWNDLTRPYQYNSAVLVANRALTAYEKAVVSRVLVRYVPVVGVNLALNPGMDAEANWTRGTGWTIGSGVATKSAGTASTLVQAVATSTKTYFVNADLNQTAGTIGVMDGSATQRGAYLASGALSNTVVAAGTSIGLSADSSFAGTVDNVTVREVL